MNSMFIRARYNCIQLLKLQRNWRKARFSFWLRFPPSSNGMTWYSYSLPFLLMQWDARICFAFTCIAIPADAYLLRGYVFNGCVLKGYVSNGYVWKGYVYTEGTRIGGIRIEWIRIETISIDRIRVEWICVGWCLCASNLQKNPATKRLSGNNLSKNLGITSGPSNIVCGLTWRMCERQEGKSSEWMGLSVLVLRSCLCQVHAPWLQDDYDRICLYFGDTASGATTHGGHFWLGKTGNG